MKRTAMVKQAKKGVYGRVVIAVRFCESRFISVAKRDPNMIYAWPKIINRLEIGVNYEIF